MKNEKGITLISLVMTVILVVILAAISTYTGIESYNNMKVQAFVAKMIAIQEKVDIFCDKYTVTEINNMTTDSPGEEAKQVLEEVIAMGVNDQLKSWFDSDENSVNYKYFSIRNIEDILGFKDFDVAIWINPATRNVVAVEGVEYNDIDYYRQYDLVGGQTLEAPVVDTNYTLTSDTDYNLYTYDNKAIVKFTKQYETASYTIKNGHTKTFSNVSEIELPYTGLYTIQVKDAAQVTKSVDNLSVTIVNEPMLVDGMTPIKLNAAGTAWVDTTKDDPSWYNYDSSVKKWANVKLKDGSVYVWIPRYAYKIDSTTIDIKFLTEFSDICTSGKALDTTYKVMPAFQNGIASGFANGEWDNEITGFWVAKYETICKTDNTLGNIPQNISTSTACWTNIAPAEAFKKCRMMEVDYKTAYFGDKVTAASGTASYGEYTVDTNNLDTHLIKNSEWGAVVYLTWSVYGYNGNVAHKSDGYLTNGLNGAAYCSTKTNITGVYGLSGGGHDLVAAGPNIATYYNSTNTSTKYATVYNNDISASTIYGDAMKETMSWGQTAGTLSNQLICRGGYYAATSGNSILSYQNKNYGESDIVTFRPVIIVEY